MTRNRKQPITPPMPAKVGHEVVLSPHEKKASTAAAWPTGSAHLWLKRAPNGIVLPAARRPKPNKAK